MQKPRSNLDIKVRIKMKIYLVIIYICITCIYCNHSGTAKKWDHYSYKPIKEREASFFCLSGIVDIKIDGQNYPLDWTCYESMNSKVRISVPSKWVVKNDSVGYFYSDIEKKGNNYFTVVGFDKAVQDADLEVYFKHAINLMKNDTIEILKKIDVQKVAMIGNKAYRLFFKTKVDSITYKIYSFYTETNDNVFDFTMKKDTRYITTLDSLIFDTVVSSFRFDGDHVISKYIEKRDIYLGVK